VPDEVSGRARGRSFSRFAHESGWAWVKAWDTVKPNAPLMSRVVILFWNLAGSCSTILARLARPVGASGTSVVL